MKRWVLVLIVMLIILFGFLIGKNIYTIVTFEEELNMEIAKTQEIEDECTAEYEYYEELEVVNAKQEKVSPNAKLVTNIYYDECGHTIKKINTIEDTCINLTQEELAEKYNGWEIKKFSPEEISLYKQETGICNEHYIIREKDGYVVVYSLDSNEDEILKQTTEIATEFLTATDIAKLQDGIKLYGRENLNSLLEDLE